MIILDRIEGYMAILEVDGEIIEIPRRFLPKNVKEGDMLRIIIDETATMRSRNKIQELSDQLFE